MSLWLRIAVLLGFLCVLFLQGLDVRHLARQLGDFSLGFGLLAAAVVMADRWLMTYKWTLLLRAQGHRLAMLPGMTIYCSSMLWGAALPTTVGADAVRAVLAVKRGIGGTDVAASILVERMIGFLAALLLALVSLVLLRTSGMFDGRYDFAFYTGAGLLLSGLALIALSANEKIFGAAVRHLPRRWRRGGPVRQLERLAQAYRALETARGIIAVFTLLTLIEQLFGVTMTWVLARGLDIDVDGLALLAVVPVATLISRVPISLDGLGVYETVFAALLALAGVSTSNSVAIALIGRAIQLLCVLPWWVAQVINSGRVRPPQPA